jgi:hypothetical protein
MNVDLGSKISVWTLSVLVATFAATLLAGCGQGGSDAANRDQVTRLEKDAAKYAKDPWEQRLMDAHRDKLVRETHDPWEDRLIAEHTRTSARK